MILNYLLLDANSSMTNETFYKNLKVKWEANSICISSGNGASRLWVYESFGNLWMNFGDSRGLVEQLKMLLKSQVIEDRLFWYLLGPMCHQRSSPSRAKLLSEYFREQSMRENDLIDLVQWNFFRLRGNCFSMCRNYFTGKLSCKDKVCSKTLCKWTKLSNFDIRSSR